MSRFMLSLAVVGILAVQSFAQANAVGEDVLRASVARGLKLIQHSQVSHLKTENCASCHHQLLPEMPMRLARSRGIPVDETTAQKITDDTFGYLKDLDGFVQGTMYIDVVFDSQVLWAANEAGIPANHSTTAYAQYIASRQLPDGHWAMFDTRPPASASPITTTALAARAVQIYLPDRSAAVLAKARKWIAEAKTTTTEDRVFQLLGLMWTGADEADRKKLGSALLTNQGSDGGWSQYAWTKSDSYATGQVLSTLHVAAGLNTNDPAYQKGLQFLVSTQAADGSWLVPTRMHPPAPVSPEYFNSHYPYGANQFISIMGASWAMTAMLHALPAIPDARPRRVIDAAPPQREKWIQAALTGTVDDLKKLLAGDLKPDAATEQGTTLLMMSAQDLGKVKLLVEEHKADVNLRSKAGANALTVAARYGNIDVVRYLLSKNAEVNAKDQDKIVNSTSPLFFAVATGNTEMAELLLKAGSKPNIPMKLVGKFPVAPLFYAVMQGDAKMTKLLIKHGCNVNELDRPDGMSVLAAAAIHKYPETIPVLLAAGAKVDFRDETGMTPLMYAASIDFGDTMVLEALLNAGAKRDIKNKQGLTALDLATKYDHKRQIERLGGK